MTHGTGCTSHVWSCGQLTVNRLIIVTVKGYHFFFECGDGRTGREIEIFSFLGEEDSVSGPLVVNPKSDRTSVWNTRTRVILGLL
jgi:hypothetical protein